MLTINELKNKSTLKNYTQGKLFSEAGKELELMYNLANELFERKGIKVTLPVLLTIQTKGKHHAYGWVTCGKVWENQQGEELAYELNIAAETLGRPIAETFNTVVHEMCHLVNIQRKVQDCTNSQRHNKKFKEVCDKVGLYCEEMGRFGWAATHEPMKNSCELKAVLDQYFKYGNTAALAIQRTEFKGGITKGGSGSTGTTVTGGEGGETTKKKSNQVKYVCHKCGKSIRATSKVNIMCLDCMEVMVAQE